MNSKQMHLNYREAIHMIRVGRYEESLALLKAIDAERPNLKNVVYPMAVCCERLGQIRESYELCSRLIEQHNHEKAQVIKARLELLIHPEETPAGEAAATPPNTESLPPDETQHAALEQTTPAKRRRMPLWMVILVAMAAAAGTAAFLYAFVLRA